MLIGDVIRRYPSTEEVFSRLFGKGCFTCPGSNNEDIEFGSAMHNVDVGKVLEELNAATDKDSGGSKINPLTPPLQRGKNG